MTASPVDLLLEIVDETGLAARHLGLIRAVVLRAVESDGLAGRYQLTVTLVDDERMRGLNRAHREIDEATDVLSFPLRTEDPASFVLPPDEPTHLGDVVISLPRAVDQAEAYGHSLERELAYLAVHGVLHLLGFDHEDEADRQVMRTREEEILVSLPR